MNIGQASRSSGVSAKMIRYYESIGLLPEAARKESGYRDYDTMDVHRLAFVRRARDLGFSIEMVRELLLLWSDRDRGNADVRAVANVHIAELQAQALKLEEMIATLRHLVKSCRGENRAECPIMADLSRGAAPPAPKWPQRKSGLAVRARA
jgi:Cu(I)-responsive transcriptional regulator